MDQRKLIYNQVATLINTEYPNVYCTQRIENISRQFPAVCIEQSSRIRTRRYACLDNTDDQCRIIFEVNVYADTMNEAYEVMRCVEESFKSIGFFEDICSPVGGLIEQYRIVARFSAQLGAMG